jgi:hypothetical protein
MADGYPLFKSQETTNGWAAQSRMVLVLPNDGGAWEVEFSRGIEKFIGRYPRLPELCLVGHSFLSYHEVPMQRL